MFRVNSTSKQIVRLNVIESGRSQLVDLLPKNFVFSEVFTSQMKILEKDGVIKVREVKIAVNKEQQADGDVGGKVAKVQKKKK